MNDLRASLVELWSKANPFNVSEKVYSNGDNDQYPAEIEQAISNSPNGVRAWTVFRKYVAGKGLDSNPDISDITSLWDVVSDISASLTMQGGFFVHRTIKVDTDPDSDSKFKTGEIKVLDFNKCRISKADDEGNEGRIKYGRFSYKTLNWFNKNKKKNTWFYPFSDKDNVIEDQIRKDAKDKDTNELSEMIPQYRGQVMFVNMTSPNDIYPLSPFNSVFNDLDTDYRLSLYSNKMFRSGFLGKLMILFSGLSEDDSKQLRGNVKNWLGSENSDNIYVAEVENIAAIKDSFSIKQIDSQYDDDISVNTEKRIKENISGCASNVPHVLLYPNDSSLFGGSGQLLRQSMDFYNDQTEEYRMVIEKSLSRLGFSTKIEKL